MSMENSPAEVCARFDISKSTLFRWEGKGHIPAPDRNMRGERCYSEADCEAIAQFVQRRRHRKRYAEILSEQAPAARSRLQELGEDHALFKFVNRGDPTGLAELREYSPLKPSTIRQLLRVATDEYAPNETTFWEIIDIVCDTSDPRQTMPSV